jgi:superfamily II DNA/RNA helicase
LMTLGETKPGRPGGLVLVPTRELAQQVHEVLKTLAEAVGRRTVAIYGGADIEGQTRRLKKGSDVVIATPGRLIDLIDRNEISVAAVAAVVIDEADRMADMGFLPQVDWVLRRIECEHQTMLFSATLDGDVNRLVKRHLRDPVFHHVESPIETVESMEHRFLLVHEMDKVKVAAAIAEGAEKTIMFVRTKRGADKLVLQLSKEGVRALAIHGDLRQSMRDRALDDFSKGRLPALVATDVAARGLDIEDVGVVIHFDPPEDQKAYVHRSGRTARAGDSGVVATLVLWNQVTEVERIQKRLGLSAPIVEVFSNNPHLADLAAWRSDEGAA